MRNRLTYITLYIHEDLRSYYLQIREIFKSLDDSGDRLIDFKEFKVLRVYNYLCEYPWLQEVMRRMNEKGWVKETKAADQISEEEIRKVFDIVDKDKSGSLSRREAKRACKLIAEKFGITEVTEFGITEVTEFGITEVTEFGITEEK